MIRAYLVNSILLQAFVLSSIEFFLVAVAWKVFIWIKSQNPIREVFTMEEKEMDLHFISLN